MGVERIEYVPKSRLFISKIIVIFVLFFATTPFMIDIRIDLVEIWAPFYSIIYSNRGVEIDAPYPRMMHLLPNPFWWIDWIAVIFMFVLAAHFAGWTSEKNAKLVGLMSLGPGLLTFFVNFSGIFAGSINLAIPVLIPTIIGLFILYSYPLEQISPWPDLDG